jgi:hypothetical protein
MLIWAEKADIPNFSFIGLTVPEIRPTQFWGFWPKWAWPPLFK